MGERLGAYLRTAFATRWNLLFVGGAVAAALISGFPTVVLPVVAAGEIFYLASMVASDRFRSAVDAQDAKARRQQEAIGSRESYEKIRDALSPQMRERFDKLRQRCAHLVELADELRGGGGKGSLEALERLLWGYLRMILGAQTLSEFLEHTDDVDFLHPVSFLNMWIVPYFICKSWVRTSK